MRFLGGDKGLSKQRRWQLRHKVEGLCALCSAKLATSHYCLHHATVDRDRKRAKLGSVKQYNSLTRRLEAGVHEPNG